MSLRDRLSRLGPAAPLSPSERESRSGRYFPAPDALPLDALPLDALPLDALPLDAPPLDAPPLDAPPLGAAPPHFEGSRASTLDDLRAKMDALLERPGRPAPPKPVAQPRFDPVSTTLPFVERHTLSGRLSQRLSTQGRGQRIGRIPLAAAAEGDPGLLSLLALDPLLAACDLRKALFLDTETTGLGGAGTVAFLLGLGWFDEDGCFVLEQLLLRNPAEERALLARLDELIHDCSLLVSFNGKSFDLPLLQGRRVMNRLPELPRRPHLDLLHVSRRIHKPRLSRCRLIDLESAILGWERGEDDIPGAEIAPRYGHFLRTGDEEALRAVVDHNAWDVLSMAALMGLYGESLEQLDREDWAGVAKTLTRAKAYDQAQWVVDRALEGNEPLIALEARARLFKARGDRARALADFERLAREIDDPGVRLELVKLYEHHERDFERALLLMQSGTGESVDAAERRRVRLRRRAEQKERRAVGAGLRRQRTPPPSGESGSQVD